MKADKLLEKAVDCTEPREPAGLAFRPAARPYGFGLRRVYGLEQEATVFDRILKRLREKVRTRQYVVTLHADEEMEDDRLKVFDMERV